MVLDTAEAGPQFIAEALSIVNNLLLDGNKENTDTVIHHEVFDKCLGLLMGSRESVVQLNALRVLTNFVLCVDEEAKVHDLARSDPRVL